jgi:Ribbon-helix-helix protein, copG family
MGSPEMTTAQKTTPRQSRNRPLGTISLSPEAWNLLDKLVSLRGGSRSAMIEALIRAAIYDLPAAGRKAFARMVGRKGGR